MEQLLQWMKTNDVFCCLIVNPIQIQYLTGFVCDPHERFLGLCVLADGQSFLVVPALEREKVSKTGIQFYAYLDNESPYECIKNGIGDRFASSCSKDVHLLVALDKDVLTVSKFEHIKDALSVLDNTFTYISLDTVLAEMRAIKLPHEIDNMSKAAQITDQILTEICQEVRIGISEKQLVSWIEHRASELGASEMAFETMVLFGAKSALPHGVPGDVQLQAGQFILLDFGVFFQGYCSDITRTLIMGRATEEQKKMYNAVKMANEQALSVIRPGITAASVDLAARKVLYDLGYGEFFTHRLGHGLGIECHEFPSVHAGNQYVLVPGVTFTVEPGVYLPGVGGVRIEDDVVVTADGVQTLTTFTKELIEID